jgi:hypothetical protein
MEAHRERLAHQPGMRAGDDVAGVGVDAGQAADLHGDAGLLGRLPDRRIGRALSKAASSARSAQFRCGRRGCRLAVRRAGGTGAAVLLAPAILSPSTAQITVKGAYQEDGEESSVSVIVGPRKIVIFAPAK